ncbi:11619_t:CDS:2, partial [Funneliformis mosseae]
MTSELPASPSEIHVDNTEVFQLKALSLNFLRNTSEITDEHIPKLNPCHFCDKEILALPLPLHSFTVLSCGHIYHRICLEKHIVRLKTRFPLCPISSCISPIELIREELSLASEDEDSLVGQGGKRTEVTTYDQATSLIAYVEEIPELSDIIDDAENDDNGNNNHSSQIRMDNSTNQTTEDDIANTQIRSSRETSPRINREQERFRGLLHKLSTPIKGETTETNNEDEGSGGSISQNLARLFQKAIKAEKRVTQAYQEEIH